jgi:hypothetical protein
VVATFVRGDLAAVGRTTMSHPEHELRVTLYPVFHIGSPAFYAALSEDLARFRVFLLEGLRWRRSRASVYGLAARNLGLVAQFDQLRLPPGAERLPMDMDAAAFAAAVRDLPVSSRLMLRFLRPVLWAATLTEAGRHLVWDGLSKERHVRSLQEQEPPVMQLVRSKRDRVMADRLRRFVEDPARIAKGEPVAVIAGAGHMPALYATLRDCGFQKGSVRWFEVLDGLTIPSRGTPGRARPSARD